MPIMTSSAGLSGAATGSSCWRDLCAGAARRADGSGREPSELREVTEGGDADDGGIRTRPMQHRVRQGHAASLYIGDWQLAPEGMADVVERPPTDHRSLGKPGRDRREAPGWRHTVRLAAARLPVITLRPGRQQTDPPWLKLAEFTSHAMALADEVPRCFFCIPLVSAYAIDRCRRIRSARGVAFRPSAETMAVIRISIGGGAHLTGAIKVRLRSSGCSSGWRSHG